MGVDGLWRHHNSLLLGTNETAIPSSDLEWVCLCRDALLLSQMSTDRTDSSVPLELGIAHFLYTVDWYALVDNYTRACPRRTSTATIVVRYQYGNDR
jgi:hypothetical protein